MKILVIYCIVRETEVAKLGLWVDDAVDDDSTYMYINCILR